MYQEKSVVSFKLGSGEEIVARFLRFVGPDFIVEHPTTLMPTQGKLTLVPAMFTGNLTGEVKISGASVVMTAPAKDDIASLYLEAISGLTLPKTSKIIME